MGIDWGGYMKAVLACVVFLVVSAWSSVNLIWTEFQFEKGYLEVDTAKICNVDTTYINCSQCGYDLYQLLAGQRSCILFDDGYHIRSSFQSVNYKGAAF